MLTDSGIESVSGIVTGEPGGAEGSPSVSLAAVLVCCDQMGNGSTAPNARYSRALPAMRTDRDLVKT